MNAIVFSAIWGVVMMFTGLFTSSTKLVLGTAIAGLLLLLILNYLDTRGMHLVTANLNGMLYFESYGYLFDTINKTL